MTERRPQLASTVCLIGFVLVMLGAVMTVSRSQGLGREQAEYIPTVYRIDLNSADAATLQLLPGIGPQLGQKIVEHRANNVSWTAVDQLQTVSGIGPGKVAAIQPWVACVPPLTNTPRENAQAASPW